MPTPVSNTPTLSLILPCYNEEGIIHGSMVRIYDELNKLQISYEVILVDDCSTDNTLKTIESLKKQYPSLLSEAHQQNKGRGAAVKTGISVASGKIVGFMDIDLEVSPVYLREMLLAMEGGFEVVSLKRNYKWNASWFIAFRHILSRGYSRLSKKILNLPFKDTETGFKFFERNALNKIVSESQFDGWFWDTEIMALAFKNKLKVIEIEGEFIKRTDKVSSVNGIRDSVIYFVHLLQFRFLKHKK